MDVLTEEKDNSLTIDQTYGGLLYADINNPSNIGSTMNEPVGCGKSLIYHIKMFCVILASRIRFFTPNNNLKLLINIPTL